VCRIDYRPTAGGIDRDYRRRRLGGLGAARPDRSDPATDWLLGTASAASAAGAADCDDVPVPPFAVLVVGFLAPFFAVFLVVFFAVFLVVFLVVFFAVFLTVFLAVLLVVFFAG